MAGTNRFGGNPYGRPTPGGASSTSGNYLQSKGQWYTAPRSQQYYQQQAGGSQPGWLNGKYGYIPQGMSKHGGQDRFFQAFGDQPTAGAPLEQTNPAAYGRNQLSEQYQTALDDAKSKTEERYQEALSNLDGVGEQEGADIDTRFDSSSSAVNQSLVSSGLSGTSVLPSMQRGVERERTGAQNRLASMLARERNQIIGSRNDIPPDLALYSNLMFQQGQGGGF